jgi:Endonuclease/Exonuclease/phosphatase family
MIQEKWFHINQLLCNGKIGILALQETHTTDALVSSLHSLFGKQLLIFHSMDPDSPNSKGVAIVLNKEILHTDNVQIHDIIPGCALLLSVPWHTSILTILAIYAPNPPAENCDFWLALHQKWNDLNLPKPDIMLGDFNLVEEALDWLPSHPDNQAAVHSLEQLKSCFHVQDGW